MQLCARRQHYCPFSPGACQPV